MAGKLLVNLTGFLITLSDTMHFISKIGMINNYQREAGPEDDRDSGSISLITHLENGDQV